MRVSKLSYTLGCLLMSVGLIALAGCQTTPQNDATAIDDTLAQSAETAERTGEYTSAIDYYSKLVEANPDDLDLKLGLARNLRYVGAPQDAVNLLETGNLLAEPELPLLLELAKAKIAAGKANQAINYLVQAQGLDAENWEIHSLQGIAFDLSDDFDQARKAYETALLYSEDNPTIYNNMAISAALSGDIDRAIEILNDVPRLSRNNPQLRQNLALFYGIKGDAASAEALGRMDLDEETVQRNLLIYSLLRKN
jgi:Flp pilus assembly protein TadD